MSETVEVTRDEFEALKERVRELERELEQHDGNHAKRSRTDLDHRDDAVLKALVEGRKYAGRKLVTMYKQHTDIVDTDTAKQRAKRLQQKQFFEGGKICR